MPGTTRGHPQRFSDPAHFTRPSRRGLALDDVLDLVVRTTADRHEEAVGG
ncbi:hypothetical protein [Streptomyces sp. NPDC088816]